MQPTYDPSEDWDAGVRAYFEAAFGKEHFGCMAAALLRPPLGFCLRINPLRTTPESVVDRLPAALAREDAAMLATAGTQPHTLPDVPGVVLVPGSGPHTIDYSCTGGKEVVVSRKAGEAVMRGAQPFVPGCLAASAGLEAGDMVAVTVALEPPGCDTADITRGTTLGTGAAVTDQPDRRRLHIGLGRAMMSRGELFSGRRGVGVQMVQRVFANPSCNGVLPGEVMLQNLCSVVAAQALSPAPGSRVLDMCAAPGGKTTALAQLMGNTGTIIALERSASKVPQIRAIAQEYGLTCIQAHRMDSTKAVLQSIAEVHSKAAAACSGAAGASPAAPSGCSQCSGGGNVGAHAASWEAGAAAACAAAGGCVAEAVTCRCRCSGNGAAAPAPASAPENERQRARRHRKLAAVRARGLQPPPSMLGEPLEAAVRGFPPESFDAILLDGPCSGLGLRPRLVHRIPLHELAQAAQQQRRLIDVAAALLRPGGHLVYSTCTINPGENEANVRYALDTHPSLELVPHEPYIGGPGLAGPCESAGDAPAQAAAAAARAARKAAASCGNGSGNGSGGGMPNVSSSAAETASGGGSGQASASAALEQVAALRAEALAAAGQLTGRGLTAAEARLVQSFDPAGLRDTPGFFIAKFRKR